MSISSPLLEAASISATTGHSQIFGLLPRRGACRIKTRRIATAEPRSRRAPGFLGLEGGAMIPIGPWTPDTPDYQNQGSTEALNVIPKAQSYGPFPSFASISGALGARCQARSSPASRTDQGRFSPAMPRSSTGSPVRHSATFPGSPAAPMQRPPMAAGISCSSAHTSTPSTVSTRPSSSTSTATRSFRR